MASGLKFKRTVPRATTHRPSSGSGNESHDGDETMTQQHRGALATFIFSLVVVQGLTINLMPVLFGTIAGAFQIDLRQQGQLQSFFLAGSMIALLVSGYGTETLGAKRSGIVAVLLIGLGSLLLGLATTYYAVLAGAFVIGMGTDWILAAYSAVITVHFVDFRRRMFMWAMAAFAGSATVSTTLFGYLVEVAPQWKLVFFAFTGLVWMWFAAFLIVFREQLRTISRAASADKAAGASPRDSLVARLQRARAFLTAGIFNRVTFWLLGVLWILESLTAGGIIAWTGRLFQLEHHISSYQVGLMISASSAGVFTGRVLMGAFVGNRLSERIVMGNCLAGGTLIYAIILITPSYPLAAALMFFNGALMRAQAPTMCALASVKFGDRAATVIPLVCAIGGLGGLMGPTLIGNLADYYGLHAVLWLVPVLGAIYVACVFAWEIVDRRRSRPGLPSSCRPCEIVAEVVDQHL
jgi:fucose permease